MTETLRHKLESMRAQLEEQERKTFMMERALKRTAISLIGAHSLLKDGGKQAAIQEGYEHIFHAMLARIERDIAHARAVLNVNEVKL